MSVQNLAANEIRQKVNAECFVSITKCQNFQHYQMLAFRVPPAFPLADSFKFEIFSLVSKICDRFKICTAYRFSKLALRTEPLAAFAPFSSLFPLSAANSPTYDMSPILGPSLKENLTEADHQT
jgi:hypothetical protein